MSICLACRKNGRYSTGSSSTCVCSRITFSKQVVGLFDLIGMPIAFALTFHYGLSHDFTFWGQVITVICLHFHLSGFVQWVSLAMRPGTGMILVAVCIPAGVIFALGGGTGVTRLQQFREAGFQMEMWTYLSPGRFFAQAYVYRVFG